MQNKHGQRPEKQVNEVEVEVEEETPSLFEQMMAARERLLLHGRYDAEDVKLLRQFEGTEDTEGMTDEEWIQVYARDVPKVADDAHLEDWVAPDPHHQQQMADANHGFQQSIKDTAVDAPESDSSDDESDGSTVEEEEIVVKPTTPSIVKSAVDTLRRWPRAPTNSKTLADKSGMNPHPAPLEGVGRISPNASDSEDEGEVRWKHRIPALKKKSVVFKDRVTELCRLGWKKIKKAGRKTSPLWHPRKLVSEYGWYLHATTWSMLYTGLFFLLFPAIGPFMLLFWACTAGSATTMVLSRWWYFLLMLLGGNSIALVIALWTFTVAGCTALITYATTKVAQKRYSKQEVEEVQQGVGAKLGEVADAGFTAASVFLPRFDGKTLSNLRNVVSLFRDLPQLLKALMEWWRIFTFKPERAFRGEEYVLKVVASETRVYAIRGLSGSEMCTDVIVDGYSFVFRDDKGYHWLDIMNLGSISLKAVGPSLLLVHTTIPLKKVTGILNRTIVADATLDIHRRKIRPTGLLDIGDTTAHGVASLATQVATQQHLNTLATNPGLGFVSGGVVGGTASSANTTPTTTSAQNAQSTSKNTKSRIKGPVPAKPSKTMLRAKAQAQTQDDKGKEKESDHPVLDAMDKIVGDDGEERPQGPWLDSVRDLAVKARDWVRDNSYFSWYWYAVAFVGVSVLGMLGVGFYIVRKRKLAALEVKQSGNILKYEVNEDDRITKFQTENGKWFAYSNDKFNKLAAGKEPGEVIKVPVEFLGKNGKTYVRQINAVVSDDGQVVQAFKPREDTEISHVRTRRTAKHEFNLGLYKYQVVNDVLYVEENTYDQQTSRLATMAEAARDLAETQRIQTMTALASGAPETQQAYDGGEKEFEVRPTPTDYESTPEAKELAEAFRNKNTIPTNLAEAKQSFHDIEYNRHVYAISYINEHVATAVLIPYMYRGERVAALWCPKHYKNLPNLRHGGTYWLNNMVRVEPSTEIIYNGDWAIEVKDAYDSMIVPLTRAYAHMSMATKFAVLKDGEHTLWLHGISPRTKKPVASKVLAFKQGNKIKYKFDNDYGFCGATLSLDSDQLVVVGMHVEGNKTAQTCTASAVTPQFLEMTSLKGDSAF